MKEKQSATEKFEGVWPFEPDRIHRLTSVKLAGLMRKVSEGTYKSAADRVLNNVPNTINLFIIETVANLGREK